MSHKFIVILLWSFTSLLASSCYNEPEYRIVKPWQITHTHLNGEEITETDYYANRPGTFYYIYADCVLCVMTSYNGQIRESTSGYWILRNRNKSIEMNFTLLGYHYTYLANLQKLTKRELIYDYTDPEGNHWEIHMNSRASY